jgi:hypothetical protein
LSQREVGKDRAREAPLSLKAVTTKKRRSGFVAHWRTKKAHEKEKKTSNSQKRKKITHSLHCLSAWESERNHDPIESSHISMRWKQHLTLLVVTMKRKVNAAVCVWGLNDGASISDGG